MARGKNKAARDSVLRFTNLRLENWKNFTSVDVELQRRVFLVGPNASGKSNLFDAFRFLRDVASIGGGLAKAVEHRGGISSIRSLSARRHSDIVVVAELSSARGDEHWKYELALTQDNQRRPRVKREIVTRGKRVLLKRPDADDDNDSERLTQTHLEQVQVNKAFRDLGSFFSSIQYLHIVPQLVREPDRSVGKTDDPFGGDFLEQVARTPARSQEARLRRIADALKVAVPQLSKLELWKDETGVPHLRGRYQHWRPQGAWQGEDQFSDGTLRLMGLLWAAQGGRGPLLLEEPELSLHPGVVRYLPQLFARLQRKSGRQLFISSHSPELFLDPGIGLDEVLLLSPLAEGTIVNTASTVSEVKDLLEGGASLADVLMPITRPRRADQLVLFDL